MAVGHARRRRVGFGSAAAPGATAGATLSKRQGRHGKRNEYSNADVRKSARHKSTPLIRQFPFGSPNQKITSFPSGKTSVFMNPIGLPLRAEYPFTVYFAPTSSEPGPERASPR